MLQRSSDRHGSGIQAYNMAVGNDAEFGPLYEEYMRLNSVDMQLSHLIDVVVCKCVATRCIGKE